MLTLKEQRRLKEYEDALAMPKWKFILIYGLSFAILAFILTTSYNCFFDKKSFHWDIRLLLSAIIMIPVGGFLYGWIMRKLMRRYYKKLKLKAD